ncbi:MAG: helix-turn-helix transcriptional regulator, partial [Atopobiaceae bacterium]|nr:helix-turn-helix transcriptional regulator [Atopobiaceae bacterium]
MSFRDNLQHLRATRNMTQEQLAMMVGVSRQSVTKWEAERAYPEMDKLLKLCQIFDCTLDELVQGDLTARAPEPALAVPTGALAEDVIGYDEHHHSFALRIAVGVACCILGGAAAAVLEGWYVEAFSVTGLFFFVGVGLIFIIPAMIEHSAFQKAHPYVADFYGDEQRLTEKRVYGYRLASGICTIFVAVAAAAFLDGRIEEGLTGGLTLLLIAAGVGLIVYASLIENRLDIEGYNLDALEDLSEEEIA